MCEVSAGFEDAGVLSEPKPESCDDTRSQQHAAHGVRRKKWLVPFFYKYLRMSQLAIFGTNRGENFGILQFFYSPILCIEQVTITVQCKRCNFWWRRRAKL